jgi:hypothetical protein
MPVGDDAQGKTHHPHHKHHHHRTSVIRALLQRPPVRLAIVAGVCFGLIVLLLRPSSHDPHWWKHAGIKNKGTLFSDDGNSFVTNTHRHHGGVDNASSKHEDHVVIVGPHDNNMPPKRDFNAQVQAVTTKKGKPAWRPLVENLDYFADYDISKVLVDPDPPIPEGKKLFFNYIDPELNDEYAMRYVSNKPRVLMVQDFLTPAECDALVDAASKKLFRSQVAPVLNSKDNPVNDVRTSSQAWLPVGSPEVKPIADRILKLTGFPQGSTEELQILKYELNQKYDAHNDYFDPKMYGKQQTNRAITVFIYLSDVEEGGETQFPRADNKPPTFDYTSCTHGLRVHPRKGQLALFYDMTPLGELDPTSLHGGCPVKKGVKWGGTLWLRVPFGGT